MLNRQLSHGFQGIPLAREHSPCCRLTGSMITAAMCLMLLGKLSQTSGVVERDGDRSMFERASPELRTVQQPRRGHPEPALTSKLSP